MESLQKQALAREQFLTGLYKNFIIFLSQIIKRILSIQLNIGQFLRKDSQNGY